MQLNGPYSDFYFTPLSISSVAFDRFVYTVINIHAIRQNYLNVLIYAMIIICYNRCSSSLYCFAKEIEKVK